MTNHILINLTFQLQDVLPGINEACWQWCSEQAITHQSNIDISNLGVIALAMFVLLLYNISIEWADDIKEKLKLSKDTLIFYGHILVFFTFMLLAVFLGYYALFN